MVAKLSVQIALEGGKEIEAQLESISKAGAKVFSDLNNAAAKAGGFDKLDTGAIDKAIANAKLAGDEIGKVKKALADTANLEKLVQALSLVDGAFNKLGISARALLLALGPLGAIITVLAVAFGVAFVAAAINAAQSLSEMERSAIKFGSTFQKMTQVVQGLNKAGIPFEAISSALTRLQSQGEQFKLDQVQAAIAEVQKLNLAGWASASGEKIRFLQQMAEGVGPAAEAARKALADFGMPIQDRVTPALEAMIRSAGSVAAAIPQIGQELARLGTAGEKARFMEEIFKRIQAAAPDAVTSLRNVIAAFEQMPASVERDQAVIRALGDDMGTRLVQAAKKGPNELKQTITELIETSKGLPQAVADGASKIDLDINKIKAAFSGIFANIPLSQLSTAMDGIARAVQGAADKMNQITWDNFNSGVATATTGVQTLDTATGGLNTTTANLSGNVASFGSAWGSAESSGTSAIGQINSSMDTLIGKLRDAVALMGQLGSGGGGSGGGAPRLAGGGLMGGRGTGTSDNNLAWLSRGEHVMPARAVRQPGVLALLEALRRSGGNLSGVLDRIGGFALGGLVGPQAVPAFAGGGVNNMSHVTIAFPGLPAIGGLRASSAVVEELQRAAAMAQVRSGGRKPSRYG